MISSLFPPMVLVVCSLVVKKKMKNTNLPPWEQGTSVDAKKNPAFIKYVN